MRNERPHIDRYTFINRIVDGTLHARKLQAPELLPHMVHGFGRIHAGMIVLHFITDTRNGGKVQTYITVLAAACCYHQWLAIIGFTHLRREP